jgi:hypothetical protein
MRRREASRDYQRLLRGEIGPDQYCETLRRESDSEVERAIARRLAAAKAAA